MRPSRSLSRAAIVVALLTAASGARASGLGTDFMACVGIDRAARRLACYDRVASMAKTAPQAAKPDFALDKPLRTRVPLVEAPATTVGLVSVRENADGKPVFTLVDGQVWQGEDDDPVYPDPSGNFVTITRSGFGLGYHLQMNRETRVITVRRIE